MPDVPTLAEAADLKERFLTLGIDPVGSTPDEMASFMRREQERYATIIKNAGIKIER